MSAEAHRTIDLPQGTIRYRDRGEGEPIVFVHGYLVDSRLWDGPAELLAGEFRCLQPDWPMGSQRLALKPDADLSPPGVARMIADFIAALELDSPTIVGNDSGGAMSQILAANHPESVGRLVLTNCDTEDNFPPAPFHLMPPLARLPGGMTALALPFRLGPVRRTAYSAFVATEIPDELSASWIEPGLKDDGVKRDLRKLTAGMNKRYTLDAAEKLRDFEAPTLFAWAPDDRFFPLKRAEHLAAQMPNARIETIDGAKTFVALDQPQRLAETIAEFVRETELSRAA